MSLLMEALRKAEAAKKKAQQEGPAAASDKAPAAAPVEPSIPLVADQEPEPPTPSTAPVEQASEPVAIDDDWLDPEQPRLDEEALQAGANPLDFDLDFLAENASDAPDPASQEVDVVPVATAADNEAIEIDFGEELAEPKTQIEQGIELDLDELEPAADSQEGYEPELEIEVSNDFEYDTSLPTSTPDESSLLSGEEPAAGANSSIVADRLSASGSAPLEADEKTIEFEVPPEPVPAADESTDNESYSTFEFDDEGLGAPLEEGSVAETAATIGNVVTFSETPGQEEVMAEAISAEIPAPEAQKTGLTTRDLIDESEPDFSMDDAAREIFADENPPTDNAEDLALASNEPEEEVDEFEKATRALLQKEEAKAEERSEFEKQHASKMSARSIFAAKRGASAGGKSRLLIGGSSIAALLLIAAGAYYYFLILPGSGGMGLSNELAGVNPVPQQNPIPSPVPETVEEPTTEDSGIEPAANPVDESIDQLPLESAFTVVIGEDTTVVEEVRQEPSNSEPTPQLATSEPTELAPAATEAEAEQAESLASQTVPPQSADVEATMRAANNDAELATTTAAAVTDSTTSTGASQVEETTPEEVMTASAAPAVASTEQSLAAGNSGAAGSTEAATTPAAAEQLAEAAISFTPSSNSISFRKTESEEDINPLIDRAYAAYQRGVTSLARQLYQEVLDDSPYHRDALLGLAAIAAANQETLIALQYYDRILARYPNDPIARAARLEYSPPGTDISQERELRELAEANPDAPSLPYALGNLFASQNKWSQAQQAYFDALSLAKAKASRGGGPVNPDYAFNLAVSLEHLNQATSAQIYYREALEFSNRHFASFDVPRLRARLESNNRASR